jgi:hypothetical protein
MGAMAKQCQALNAALHVNAKRAMTKQPLHAFPPHNKRQTALTPHVALARALSDTHAHVDTYMNTGTWLPEI